MRVGSAPLAGTEIAFSCNGGEDADAAHVEFRTPGRAVTDHEGRVVVEQAPPGLVDVTCVLPGRARSQHSRRFEIAAGATTRIQVGGTGRAVIGRVNPPPTEGNDHIVELVRLLPSPFREIDWDKLTTDQRKQLMTEARKSPQYAAWQRDSNPFRTDVARDGSFRMEDVPEGDYQLMVAYWNLSRVSRYLETIGEMKTTLTVAPMPGGRSDEPLDLGTIQLPLRKRLVVGEDAPELAWSEPDGKAARLAELRGKYVLGIVLRGASDDMWEDLLKLKPVWDRFGADPRLVMLGLYAAPDFDQARQSATRAGVAWPLVRVGDRLDSVSTEYRSSGEMMFVIDPQGKVLARDLEPQRAWYALDQALGAAKHPAEVASVSVKHLPPGPGLPDPTLGGTLPTAADDAVQRASFEIVDGVCGRQPASLLGLGTLPSNDDAPDQNFRFADGTLEGRLRIDLGRPRDVERVITCSRHKRDRAPQVYTLYASDGASSGFDPAPKIGTDPTTCGWTRIGAVDTRTSEQPRGGTYAVTVELPPGASTRCRYLLFEMFPTETVDPFGHTFYSQIRVVERKPGGVARN